jgi:hypothetical protein
MNTLHTDEWTLRDSGNATHMQEGCEDQNAEKPSDEERHYGVRLCGECSVGHCPECGTQLVPHLPASTIDQDKHRGKQLVAGLRTVIWHTQKEHTDLIVRCPNGDYERTIKAAHGGGSVGVGVGVGGNVSVSRNVVFAEECNERKDTGSPSC